DDDAPSAQDISGLRGTQVERLRKQLSGDLDHIILMALRKEADRRYQSADQFLEDIRRYLAGLPVHAQSATWAYRTAKFVRRHRVGVAASVSLTVLIVVLAGMAFQFALVTSEQNEEIRIALEKKDQVTDLVLGMFEMSDPEFSRGREITAREILERGAQRIERELQNQPDVKAEMLHTIGTVYMQLGLFEEAEPGIRRALEMRREIYGDEDSEELAQSLYRMALWMEEMGGGEDARVLHEEALAMRERLFEAPHSDIAASLNDFGVLMISYFDDLDEAERLLRGALEMRLALEGPESKDISETMSNLAYVRNELEDYGEAESLYRSALAMQQSVLGEDHPYVASNLHNLGTLMFDLQSYDEAETLFRRAMSLRETLYGPRHNQVANSMNYLGRTLQMKGVLSEAEPLLRTSLRYHEEEYGPIHPRVARDRQMLGRLLFERGARTAAIREIEQALSVFEQTLPPEHRLIAEARDDLARMQGE
ncbi:MAG: tetratricopeptide repeat protein, partial [Bacteroidetes bacterium]|nr:tetratricopeptide repeat protein [Bacteroidota bacterium]